MHRRFGCAFAALVVLLFAAGGAVGSPAAPQAPAAEAVPTGRLPRGVVPTHVGIALRIDPAQARFTGEVRLDVRVERATRTIWLHCRGREPRLNGEPATRRAARDWIDVHFDAVAARLAPFGAGMANAYALGLCGRTDADALEARFAERLRNLQGGPRTLAQATERVRLCAALQARHQGSAWQLP